MTNKTTNNTIRVNTYGINTTHIIITALQTCITLVLVGLMWYKQQENYQVYKSTFKLQTFQNIYNFKLIVEHPYARDIISNDFLNFIIGGWIYIQHISHLLQHIEENDNTTLVYDQIIANSILTSTQSKIKELQTIATKDKNNQWKKIALVMLDDYIHKHKIYNIVDALITQEADSTSYRHYQQNVSYYNHVVQNTQVVKFLSTLDKAHDAILQKQ